MSRKDPSFSDTITIRTKTWNTSDLKITCSETLELQPRGSTRLKAEVWFGTGLDPALSQPQDHTPAAHEQTAHPLIHKGLSTRASPKLPQLSFNINFGQQSLLQTGPFPKDTYPGVLGIWRELTLQPSHGVKAERCPEQARGAVRALGAQRDSSWCLRTLLHHGGDQRGPSRLQATGIQVYKLVSLWRGLVFY